MIHWFFYPSLILFSLILLAVCLKQEKQKIAIMANTIKLLAYQEKEHLNKKTEKEKSNEDFLKFISDSRDWAFAYIEVTQDKVDNFINDVGPVIDYLEMYSPPVLAETQRISLVDGYKIIKTILPEDYGKIDT